MLKNYLLITFRNLKRHKVYSFINVAGLAIGMACCILILLWVRDEISYDRFHNNADNLYRVLMHAEDGTYTSTPWQLMPTLKRDFPEITKGTRYAYRTWLTKYRERWFYEEGALVDPEFFEMFTFRFLKGNPETAFLSLNSVVLTEETAKKYFEEEDPLGKILNFDNNIDLTVTGVVKNVSANSSIQFDFLAPVRLAGEQRLNSWWIESTSYVLLSANTDPEQLHTKISGTVMKYDKRMNKKSDVDLQPLKKIHLYAVSGTDPVVYVYIFSAVAVIVLLIACINFMNLSTARSSVRSQEVGMRKVVGAARFDLIKQFLGESLLLSFIALVFAVVLVYLFLPGFNNLASKELSLNLINDFSILAGLILIALITGALAGSYPAIYLSSFLPANVLRGSRGTGGFGSNAFRKILVVAQFTAAIILIISTITVYRQINFIKTKDLGFEREHIISIPINNEIRRQYDAIKAEILKNENIVNVTAANNRPLAVGNINPVYWEGRTSADYVTFNFVTIDYDYFETFGMKMAEGRSFSRQHATDPNNYIINETALNVTGLKEPLGKMLSLWTREGKILGVVKDFHAASLHDEIRPIVFLLTRNWPHNYVFAKFKAENISSTVDFISTTVRKFAPNFPFEYTFLEDYFNQQYQDDDRIGNIFKYFTFLAIFISCLGLFGLAAFMAERRAREIAIRKVMGATITKLIGILSKEFVILITSSAVLAWPVSYYISNKLLQSYAYRTDTGLIYFAGAGILALILGLVTVSYQAIKAASANPIDSIRNE